MSRQRTGLRRLLGIGVAGLVALLGVGAVAGRPSGTIAPPQWIWWEAEAPQATNFPEQNPFAPVGLQATRALSGGKWIGAARPGKTLFLEYRITVTKSSQYNFYARKFWKHGPFKWHFDDQPWREVGRNAALLDDVGLAKFVGVNWVGLGAVNLASGVHNLRIEVDASADATAFDCFVLIDGPFLARGKLKPGEKYDVTAPEGWFLFDPAADSFGSGAALDLRSLNEKFAGEGGFIQAKGEGFVHEKTGEPIRFWGVNTGLEILGQSDADLDRYARRLAKLGVNAVRLGGPLWLDDDPTRIDPQKVARLHRLVAALKSEGIYLGLTTFFPFWLKPNHLPGVDGFGGKEDAFAIAFFNPQFQEMQRQWWREILVPRNPYTGQTLLEDPTLAFLEIINEDGLLFPTFAPYETVPAPEMKIVEKLFGRWLTRKYSGIEQALKAWNEDRSESFFRRLRTPATRGDAPSEGRVGIMNLSVMLDHRALRAQDTTAFLTELQRGYFEQMYAYLKRDLGFRGLVAGSNWVTADARIFGPLDKWSNAGCDYMDRHGYFGGPQEGERASYSISEGDRYNDASALLFETGKKPGETSFDLPLMDLAYNGKPSTISEIGWVSPNRYRSDMPVLSAAYGALQGTDAFFFFTSPDVEWPGHLTKFSLADPVGMGQFPASALLFREGLVKAAPVAIHIESRLADLYAMKGTSISAAQNLDDLRRKDLPRSGPSGTGSRDSLAFLSGRVEENVTEGGGSSQFADLSRVVDTQKKVVRSMTGELSWDYGHGLATINAPAAQGATGFLARAGTIALDDISIASQMDYASVLVVSLDDRPLRTSRRMLLQVMSEDNNYGWSAPGSGMRPILSTGEPPIVVKNLQGTVSLKRDDARSLKVTPLDWNGYPLSGRTAGMGAGPISLSPTVFSYIIEK
jgi:hypothetical protein